MNKEVVIIGATGLVGKEFTSSLLKDERVSKVTAFTRRDIGIVSEKLHQIIDPNLNPETFTGNTIKADLYICALGTTMKDAGSKERFEFVDLKLPVAFAKMAENEQAEKIIVVSAKGANAKSKVYYNRVKGQMEEEIAALAIEQIVFLHPGLLIGKREHKRALEQFGINLFKGLDTFLPKKVTRAFGTPVREMTEWLEANLFTQQNGVHREGFISS